jgi:hypothetical protein
MKGTLTLAALLFATAQAAAQQAEPAPLLRTTLEPAKVVVGQPATLVVEVLAPNYLTRPPLLPDFQIRNAVTRSGSTVNISERQGDATYAGIRYEFPIYPQEPGTFAISGQSITVTFASDPPTSRDATLPVPSATFDAFIPDAAQGLDPFISASRLTLRQEIQRSSDPLRAGDAVTRIVTVEAEGTLAMLLPPTTFAPSNGARLYPGQPQLDERVDRRTGVLTASRTDRATYMLETAGDITLPSLEIEWWSVKSQRVERTSVEAVALQVLQGPAEPSSTAQPRSGLSAVRKAMLFVLDHWLAILSSLAAIAVAILVLPSTIGNFAARIRHRRAAYRQSETFAYRELRRAAHRGDAPATYRALLTWLSRSEPTPRTLASLKSQAGDRVLSEQIGALEAALFAPNVRLGTWSPERLLRRLKVARNDLLRHEPKRGDAALPFDLNPSGASSRHAGR